MKLAIVTMAFVIYLSSCAHSFKDISGGQRHADREASVVRRSSVLSDRTPISTDFRETRLGKGNLTAVYFVDETHGWVGGQASLYKTDDGGETWHESKFAVSARAQVSKILFASPAIGWVVLQTRSDLAIDYDQNHFWLHHTRDGGQTWKLQYDGELAEITALSLVNSQEAWLTGIKFVGLRPFRYTYLVLRTADQGDHWVDVSKGLKDLTAHKTNVAPDEINQGVIGIITSESRPITILTSEMALLTTSTVGRDWQPTQVIRGEANKIGIRRFGLTQAHKLWVLGSTDSLEGVGSMLMVQDSDRSWVRNDLSAVYLTDAVDLPGNQFMACGYFVNHKDADTRHKQGAVMYSKNGGQNWSVIYDNDKETINSLCSVNGTHVFAVGENGLVIRTRLAVVGSRGE
jgi:photosystem II stability/assembly factor-like uncharacterized protein